MNKEKNKQFVYREVNRRLVNYYSRRKNKIKLKQKKVLVSIIMLSFNRVDETIFSIKEIYKNTKLPFELILFDNCSQSDQKEKLKKFIKKYKKNLVFIESEENLGCAGGRVEAVKSARGDYCLFLDNDIVVTPFYLENLLETINKDRKTVATCSKVIFPDLTIQFNGGTLKEEGEFLIFDLLDSGKLFWEQKTVENYRVCPWIPGGATLWKADMFFKFPIDSQMKGSFEDNEVSIRIKKAGYNLRNCPQSIVIHNHKDFQDVQFAQREKEYMEGRYNNHRTISAIKHFWKKHRRIFVFHSLEATYGFLGDYSKEKVFKFILNDFCEKKG